MALVLHNINGRYYWYEHYRMPGSGMKNPTTEYIGCEGSGSGHHVVSGLRDEGFRAHPGYAERHEYANQKEKEKYGEERFNELQGVIQEKLDKGELAGKYDGCNTYVNEKIPKEYHEQIRYHEEQERDYQRKHQISAMSGSKGEERKPIRTEKGQKKFAKVMREYHAGELYSRGRKVTSEEQAKAIAASEARKE